MKTLTILKDTMILTSFIAFILLLVSCGYNETNEDSKDIAEDQNDERFDNNKQEKDAQFLVNVAEINMEEIQLGQLAQQKGTTTQVKELGKMMEEAHTKSHRDLTALAKTKNIAIPTSATSDAQDTYNKLYEKSGDDFNKAYADLMVSEHKDAIDAFEKASTDSHDADIKNWATATLPDLRKHLEHSIDCQKKFADMYLQKNN